MQELIKETNLNPSIAMPVSNSQDILQILYRKICRVLDQINREHEVIPVNNGSKVNRWGSVEVLAFEGPIIRAFNLMRNYVKHIALLFGIRRAIFPGPVVYCPLMIW